MRAMAASARRLLLRRFGSGAGSWPDGTPTEKVVSTYAPASCPYTALVVSASSPRLTAADDPSGSEAIRGYLSQCPAQCGETGQSGDFTAGGGGFLWQDVSC